LALPKLFFVSVCGEGGDFVYGILFMERRKREKRDDGDLNKYDRKQITG